MSDPFEVPMLAVPLGLKPSMGPTYDALLRRSRSQLRLLHSGQAKLDQLTDEQYLRGARLVVENDQYILFAPIPDPPQGDLVGYPSDGPGPVAGRGEAANEADGAGQVGAERGSPQSSGMPGTEQPESSSDPLDLDAALDSLLGDAAFPGTFAAEGKPVPFLQPLDRGVDTEKVVAVAPRSDHPGPEGSVAYAKQPPPNKRLAPVEAKRLKVDQALGCIEQSSGMLSQVVDVLTTSSNVIDDIRDLERRTGLKSGPARTFIGSRQSDLLVEVDGHSVPFIAVPIRTEMSCEGILRVRVQFLQTKAENDVLRVDVVEASGVGVPGGVTTLGSHDVRYTRLTDWQRGVLLILRGAAEKLDLGVREGVSTTRLVRRPALVVDPGDWSSLKRLAMEALASAVLPGAAGPAGPQGESDIGSDAEEPDESPPGDDGREAA